MLDAFLRHCDKFSIILCVFVVVEKANCLNLLAMVGWERWKCILASILGGTLYEKG